MYIMGNNLTKNTKYWRQSNNNYKQYLNRVKFTIFQ